MNDMKGRVARFGDTRDWLSLGREVLDIEIEALQAVRGGLGESFVKAVGMLATCQGRVVVSGIGKSGLVGRKIAATLSSTGTPAAFLHPVEGAHGDIGMIRPGDLIIAISNSGETDELNAILPSMRALGARIIALTGGEKSTLARFADVVVSTRVPREACPLNLAPTASTTAALAMGDALAVCLIECNAFDEKDFRRVHPGGALGRRLAMRVGELMQREELPVAGVMTSLAEALRIMDAGRLGFLAVLDEERRLAGVLTDGDVRRLVVHGDFDPERPTALCMTASPKRLVSTQSAAEAVDIMEAHQITVLPVVDGESRLVGVVHLHDLLGKGRLKFAE